MHVREGSMAVLVDGESYRLINNVSGWLHIPPGQAGTVQAGESWYYRVPAGDDLTGVRNTSDEQLDVIWAPIMAENQSCATVHSGPRLLVGFWAEGALRFDEAQMVRVRLREISIPPRTLIPQAGPTSLVPLSIGERQLGAKQWIHIESGWLSVVQEPLPPEDTLEPIVLRLRAGETLTQTVLVQPPPDLRLQLLNDEDVPLKIIFWEMTAEALVPPESMPAP